MSKFKFKSFCYLLLQEKIHRKNLFSIVTLDAFISTAGVNIVFEKTKKSSLFQLPIF